MQGELQTSYSRHGTEARINSHANSFPKIFLQSSQDTKSILQSLCLTAHPWTNKKSKAPTAKLIIFEYLEI